MRAQNQSWYTCIASERSEPVMIHVYSKWELRTSHERQTLCSSVLWPPFWSQGVRLCRRCLGPFHGHRQSRWDLHWVSGLFSLPLDQHIKVYEVPTLWLKALNNINQEKWQHIRVCTLFKKILRTGEWEKMKFFGQGLGEVRKCHHKGQEIHSRRFRESGW